MSNFVAWKAGKCPDVISPSAYKKTLLARETNARGVTLIDIVVTAKTEFKKHYRQFCCLTAFQPQPSDCTIIDVDNTQIVPFDSI